MSIWEGALVLIAGCLLWLKAAFSYSEILNNSVFHQDFIYIYIFWTQPSGFMWTGFRSTGNFWLERVSQSFPGIFRGIHFLSYNHILWMDDSRLHTDAVQNVASGLYLYDKVVMACGRNDISHHCLCLTWKLVCHICTVHHQQTYTPLLVYQRVAT